MNSRSKVDAAHAEEAARGFGEAYWRENYAQPQAMEGIANAAEYVRYAKSFFELEGVEPTSIADLGCGLGLLFREFLYVFQPDRALAIDPSVTAIDATRRLELDPYNRIDVELRQQDLLSWCRAGGDAAALRFDLGICTSVLQYLDDDALRVVVPVLGERFEYLYLTVPTDVELDRQKHQVGFHDRYAIRRSAAWYHELLGEHFTFVSSRVLESRWYYSEEDSPFTDLLFRF